MKFSNVIKVFMLIMCLSSHSNAANPITEENYTALLSAGPLGRPALEIINLYVSSLSLRRQASQDQSFAARADAAKSEYDAAFAAVTDPILRCELVESVAVTHYMIARRTGDISLEVAENLYGKIVTARVALANARSAANNSDTQ